MASSLENPFPRAGDDSPRRRCGRTVAEMSERFYINLPLTVGPVEMTGPEAHHLATVCRLGAGDELLLFNGDGHEYLAQVIDTSKKTVQMDIVSVKSPARELPFQLEIAS